MSDAGSLPLKRTHAELSELDAFFSPEDGFSDDKPPFSHDDPDHHLHHHRARQGLHQQQHRSHHHQQRRAHHRAQNNNHGGAQTHDEEASNAGPDYLLDGGLPLPSLPDPLVGLDHPSSASHDIDDDNLLLSDQAAAGGHSTRHGLFDLPMDD
jgi:hypothetical protein